MQKFRLSAHKNSLDKSQSFYQLTSLLCHTKPWFSTKLSTQPTPTPISTATKITCNLPFSQLLAASSPSTNRPKSKSRYLAIVSLKHGRLVRVRSQYSLFWRSPTRQNLPPATFDASERQMKTRGSHRFKILRAVWHKTTIFAKIS